MDKPYINLTSLGLLEIIRQAYIIGAIESEVINLVNNEQILSRGIIIQRDIENQLLNKTDHLKDKAEFLTGNNETELRNFVERVAITNNGYSGAAKKLLSELYHRSPSHEWEQDTCVKCGDKDYLSPDRFCSESKLKKTN